MRVFIIGPLRGDILFHTGSRTDGLENLFSHATEKTHKNRERWEINITVVEVMEESQFSRYFHLMYCW